MLTSLRVLIRLKCEKKLCTLQEDKTIYGIKTSYSGIPEMYINREEDHEGYVETMRNVTGISWMTKAPERKQ